MVGTAAIYLLVAAAVALVWYFAVRTYNRRYAREVLRWLERALDGQGQVLGQVWAGASVFQAPLRLRTSVFQHPRLWVRLTPREMPLNWLLSWWQREPATLIFEADLDAAPGFNLEVRSHRWCGRTTRKFSYQPQHWNFEQTIPIVMTSRRQWERELTSMMNALLSCREREFLRLAFQRNSPHFTATVLLDSISPQSATAPTLFETLREVAAGASTFH